MKLTKKEKEELARRYVEILPSIEVRKNFSHGFLGVFSAFVVAGIIVSGVLSMPMLLGISLVLELIPVGMSLISNIWIYDDIKDFLDGKITVREFKLLLKSGELNESINKYIEKKNVEIKAQNEEIKRYNKSTISIDKESLSKELKRRKTNKLVQKTYSRIVKKKEDVLSK